MLYNLCISYNIEKNYYCKYNDITNIDSFINYYNNISEGYYLDNKIYKECYSNCKSCF